MHRQVRQSTRTLPFPLRPTRPNPTRFHKKFSRRNLQFVLSRIRLSGLLTKVFRNRQLALIGLPALLMALCALPFAFSDLDRDLVRSFYDARTDSWPLESSQPWHLLNGWGERPGALIGIGAIIVLIISIGRPALARSRRIALYLTTVVLAGPGIVVNVILKSHWGRPRPMNTEGLGGEFAFERLARIISNKAANRVNPRLSEASALLEELFQCDLPYCAADGRPTLTEYNRKDIDRRFGLGRG